MAKKFFINTLGCKVNQYESDALAQVLETSGFVRAGDREQAEVVIVNTCAVTHKAAAQSRRALRQAIHAHPKSMAFAIGCYAQSDPKELEKIKGVTHVVDNANKNKIPELIKQGKQQKKAMVLSGNVRACRDFPIPENPVKGVRSRPFLKIQDGCDAFCAYCIVPHTRGPARSMPVNAVLGHLTGLWAAGFSEIVFTGIHLGCYGLDLDPKTSLVKLMKKIEIKRARERVRLSSIEPNEMTGELLNIIKTSPGLCPHFHLPLQSGDDNILKKMGRPYNAKLFKNLVREIRAAVPDAGIGVDVLVGFPGESNDAFSNTLSLIERLPVSYLHVFPFSARKGTVAQKLSNQLQPDIIAKRCKAMQSLGALKRMAFYATAMGKTLSVCVEGRKDSGTGLHRGVAQNYVPVLFKADKPPETSSLVNVLVEKITPKNQVIGRITSKN